MTTIAFDVMGGDYGPHVSLTAALQCLSTHPHLKLLLVGDAAVIGELLGDRFAQVQQRLQVIHAPEVISMADKPVQAMRMKKKASMRVALELVAEGQAQACVSAGNTGALMALGKVIVRTLPGIDRPAIITRLPIEQCVTYLLDIGANVGCSADQLYQFAVMGSCLVRLLHDIPDPRVSLLNVGVEETKGNEPVRLAAQLLQGNDDINYSGFVEGDDIYKNKVNVVVCDGFVGNVALKVSEGLAAYIKNTVINAFQKVWWGRLLALLAQPVLKTIQQQLDPRYYNGASLLGLQGVVVKSHGAADALALQQAIGLAVYEVEKSIPDLLSKELEKILVS
ncbi:phosphate acyltransferase PlsX [Zooshikella ganghwensis]|uniref:phosphate acyltransferase PlsX n=1 Tax=Zooshikella ganghwensis TaxID=202772 RepID=UPI000480F9D5|nr:phosphate acyltransferase PlsX [Zooshikella ganghwensis]